MRSSDRTYSAGTQCENDVKHRIKCLDRNYLFQKFQLKEFQFVMLLKNLRSMAHTYHAPIPVTS